MPSRTWQQVLVLSPKNNDSNKSTIMLIRKTGYANIWIGDQHYYWDNTQQKNSTAKFKPVDFNKMIRNYHLSQAAKKGIVIRRI